MATHLAVEALHILTPDINFPRYFAILFNQTSTNHRDSFGIFKLANRPNWQGSSLVHDHLSFSQYTCQQYHNLILAIQNAFGEINGGITRELAKVHPTEFMVVVTYVRRTIFPLSLANAHFKHKVPVYSSILHPSETVCELHWTSRIFASTTNSGSVHRCRRKDSKKSLWKHQTFADIEAYKLMATDI